jgi:hypothetical protein
MTKDEFIQALANIPGSSVILIRAVATSNHFNVMIKHAVADQYNGHPTAELSAITALDVNEADGDEPPFTVINHELIYT